MPMLQSKLAFPVVSAPEILSYAALKGMLDSVVSHKR